MLQFEDLDELHAAFVEPLVSKVHSVTSHRKFRDDIKSKIDEQVWEEGRAEGQDGRKSRMRSGQVQSLMAHRNFRDDIKSKG